MARAPIIGVPPIRGGGGGSGGAAPSIDSSLSQAANAQLGIPLPLMYGYCRIRGDNILLNQMSNKNRVAFYLLGQAPFDGIERLWINKKLVNFSDTSLVHFHPGTDGTLGGGLNPISTGGDQNVDQFFADVAANYQPLTYSRIAYLAVNVPPDPSAPDANLDVVGDYRTSKVRIFDSNGNQTAYQFSTNGAWQVLDLILRKMLNPEWTVAAASASGGDLTAAQKARINFAAVVSAAAWCDAIIPNGQKRFESSLAIVQTVKMQQALVQMLTMSQLYITEEDGQIAILPDQPRPSTFLMTSDHIVSGSLDPNKTGLRGAANRLIATFNDLNPTDSADIDTPANSGLVRSSNVVTVKTKVQHPYLVNDNVQIVTPDDASFAGVFQVTSVPDNLHFTFAQTGSNATSGDGFTGTPESRFAQRGTAVDHERHQNAIGARGLNLNTAAHRFPLNIILGNNTMERVMRILNFIKARNLGLDVVPYKAPWQIKLTAYLDAVDASKRSLVEQLVGDVITLDATVSQELQGTYEIRTKTVNLHALDPDNGQSSSSGSGSGKGAASDLTVDLDLLQYDADYWSDVSTVVNGPASSPARGNQPPSPITDNLIRNGDFDLGALNWFNVGGGVNFFNFIAGAAGLPRGASYVSVPGTVFSNLASIELVPIDATKTYLVEAYITAVLSSSSSLFVGVREYDKNRVSFNHTQSGGFNAWCLLALSGPAGLGWTYLSAVMTGNGGANPNANQFNASAAYISMSAFFEPGVSTDSYGITGVRFSEVAAGAKAAVAGLLVASGQLVGTFKNNPVNSNGALVGSTPLTQSGTSTTINVAAFSVQYGDGVVSYNSGSVNPGAYGSYGVYCVDPAFAGGTVTFLTTQNYHLSTSQNGIVWLGTITTTSGGGGTGTGGGTGGGGGGGGRGQLIQ